jgi:hypothetical protein
MNHMVHTCAGIHLFLNAGFPLEFIPVKTGTGMTNKKNVVAQFIGRPLKPLDPSTGSGR